MELMLQPLHPLANAHILLFDALEFFDPLSQSSVLGLQFVDAFHRLVKATEKGLGIWR